MGSIDDCIFIEFRNNGIYRFDSLPCGVRQSLFRIAQCVSQQRKHFRSLSAASCHALTVCEHLNTQSNGILQLFTRIYRIAFAACLLCGRTSQYATASNAEEKSHLSPHQTFRHNYSCEKCAPVRLVRLELKSSVCVLRAYCVFSIFNKYLFFCSSGDEATVACHQPPQSHLSFVALSCRSLLPFRHCSHCAN